MKLSTTLKKKKKKKPIPDSAENEVAESVLPPSLGGVSMLDRESLLLNFGVFLHVEIRFYIYTVVKLE